MSEPAGAGGRRQKEFMSKSQPDHDPLGQIYGKSDLSLPGIIPIKLEGLPEPYRSLLAHQDDMTGTLETAYRDRVRLRVLRRRNSGGVLLREVVLVLEGNDRPVEFGVIRIHLLRLPAAARSDVLEGTLPLGRILQDHRVEYESRPLDFFQVEAGAEMKDALGLAGSPTLYGRRNRLLMPANGLLAEVIEILPPAESDSG